MKIKYPIENPHILSTEEILKTTQTDVNQGLSKSESEKRNKDFGLNIYEAQAQKSVWLILLEQFKSPIVYLLVFCSFGFTVLSTLYRSHCHCRCYFGECFDWFFNGNAGSKFNECFEGNGHYQIQSF